VKTYDGGADVVDWVPRGVVSVEMEGTEVVREPTEVATEETVLREPASVVVARVLIMELVAVPGPVLMVTIMTEVSDDPSLELVGVLAVVVVGELALEEVGVPDGTAVEELSLELVGEPDGDPDADPAGELVTEPERELEGASVCEPVGIVIVTP
jgi:hypothetical protein